MGHLPSALVVCISLVGWVNGKCSEHTIKVCRLGQLWGSGRRGDPGVTLPVMMGRTAPSGCLCVCLQAAPSRRAAGLLTWPL